MHRPHSPATEKLPAPSATVAETIIATVREITHIEKAKEKAQLSLGIRGSGITVEVMVTSKDNRNTLSLKFEK